MELSFGQKLGGGFGFGVLLTLIVGSVGVLALDRVSNAQDELVFVDMPTMVKAQELETISAERLAASRGYLVTGEPRYVEEQQKQNKSFLRVLSELRDSRSAPEQLRAIEGANNEWLERTRSLEELSLTASPSEVEAQFISSIRPARRQLSIAVKALSDAREASVERSIQEGKELRRRAVGVMLAVSIFATLFTALVALLLSRTLTRQVGLVAGQMETSSAELQASATQQASGAREQATAMSEISTTISELLATSRQIAESAQQVSSMAQRTSDAAESGSDTVSSTRDSVVSIQRQVQEVVTHMLELGKKSQQIGTILDIVFELAEQTNILAINASIEASGAGEAGVRFGVVAEEIRKLADRVGGSAKEIRGLVDEVRSAVNTTVMATETSFKAAEFGAEQVTKVTTSFQYIASLVETTMEASREIELSTKQQATAVEQVNVAISGATQATRESESSSTQVLQAVSQLTVSAKSLQRLIQSRAT